MKNIGKCFTVLPYFTDDKLTVDKHTCMWNKNSAIPIQNVPVYLRYVLTFRTSLSHIFSMWSGCNKRQVGKLLNISLFSITYQYVMQWHLQVLTSIDNINNPMTYHHSKGKVLLSIRGAGHAVNMFLTFPLTCAYNFVIWQNKLIEYNDIDCVIFEEYNDIIFFLLKHL